MGATAADPQPSGQNPAATLERAQKLHEEGRLNEARPLYEQVIPVLKSEPNSRRLGSALYLVSLLYTELGEYSKGLAAAEDAARIHRKLSDRVGEARSMNSIGWAYLDLGDYANALQYFERALDLHRAGGDQEDEIIVLNNIGNVFYFQGRYLESFGRYQAAMDLVDKAPNEEWNPHERQRTTANIAVLFQKLGRYDLALDLYTRLRAKPGVLSPIENARLLVNVGTLYRRLGDAIKALEAYRDAQRLFRLQHHYDGEMTALKNIGIAEALDLANYPEALGSFRQELKLAEQTSNRREATQAHLYSGEVLRRMSRPDDAMREFTAALAGAESMGAVEEHWKALFGRGRVAKTMGNTEEALASFRKATELVESVRARIGLSSLRAEFLADKRDVYDALLELLLSRNGPALSANSAPASFYEEVHQLMEQTRARTFKDQFHDSLESLEAQAHPDLVRRLRELRAQMSILWGRQLRADTATGGRLQMEYSSLENEYVETERKLREASGKRVRNAELSIKDIQSRLSDDTVLIEAWTGEETLAMLWISRSDTGLVRKGFSQADAQRVQDCVDQITHASSEAWHPTCDGLGPILLDALMPHLNPRWRNMILVVDERLAFLPFEVLSVSEAHDLLLDRFSISYLPSASLAPEHITPFRLGSKTPWDRTLMAFGDPAVSAPPEQGNEPLVTGGGLTPLSHSREEVNSIARIIRGRQSVHLGPDALKRYLISEDSRNYRLIHFSTHATVDADNPQRSRIVFSPEAPPASVDYLFLGEILNLDLRGTELVTLSACETAVGKLVRGEGPQDFSRAFLMGGAQATLATLWRVADAPSAAFMEQFYSYLAQGLSKGESLRRAKLRFIQAGAPLSHPYYWAGFVLHGDGTSTVQLPISWSAFMAFGAALLLLLTLSVWLIIARR